MLIKAKTIVLPNGLVEKDTLLEVRDGKILRISSATHLGGVKDEEDELQIFEADLVTPGFVDIHTHGNIRKKSLMNNLLNRLSHKRSWGS
jgi:cytosine/adenosine deaminase-related metal-dependent hydrolase